jgi:hypothetical protein
MGLDHDARLALVHIPHLLARCHCFGHALFEIGRVADAPAVAADPAEIGQAIGLGRLQAIDRTRQHQRQRVFPCALRSRKDQRLRKPFGRDRFAQVCDRCRVA